MFNNGDSMKNGLNGNANGNGNAVGNGKTNGCNAKIQKNKSMENDYR